MKSLSQCRKEIPIKVQIDNRQLTRQPMAKSKAIKKIAWFNAICIVSTCVFFLWCVQYFLILTLDYIQCSRTSTLYTFVCVDHEKSPEKWLFRSAVTTTSETGSTLFAIEIHLNVKICMWMCGCVMVCAQLHNFVSFSTLLLSFRFQLIYFVLLLLLLYFCLFYFALETLFECFYGWLNNKFYGMDVIFDVELTAKYLPKKNENCKNEQWSGGEEGRRERERRVFIAVQILLALSASYFPTALNFFPLIVCVFVCHLNFF